jgi:NAD(P)-dependent dehydrogenase (short-subunit alcohol dehydrogenase family)
MEMKNILITGSNRGIGFEIARQIGRKDFQVFISGRNEKKLSGALKKLQSEVPSAEMILMDVSSDESVMIASNALMEKGIRFDVVINNAGISLVEDDSLITQDPNVLKTIVNTNCYGLLRVCRFFVPVMKKPGRIINISSGGGSMSEPVGGWSPAYCVSKTMLNAITMHLAYELADKNISVFAVCPGWVRTDMGGRSAPRSVEKGAETPVWLASEAPASLTGKIFRDKQEIPW